MRKEAWVKVMGTLLRQNFAVAGPSAIPGATEHIRDYDVRVLNRAVAILNELATGLKEKSDLSRNLGLHKSTVHRLLAVLDRNGFVERKPGGREYGLGWRVLELGMVAALRLNILDCVKPYLAELVDRTRETADLGVLCEGEVVSLLNVESLDSVRTPATIGRRVPLHCASEGKAILAFLPSEQIQEHLKGYVFTRRTRNTITTKQRFLGELAMVRERGYAVDNEEFEEGLRCIAAPVSNHSGTVTAATSIAGPAFRITGARFSVLARAVVQVAAELSTALV